MHVKLDRFLKSLDLRYVIRKQTSDKSRAISSGSFSGLCKNRQKLRLTSANWVCLLRESGCHLQGISCWKNSVYLADNVRRVIVWVLIYFIVQSVNFLQISRWKIFSLYKVCENREWYWEKERTDHQIDQNNRRSSQIVRSTRNVFDFLKGKFCKIYLVDLFLESSYMNRTKIAWNIKEYRILELNLRIWCIQLKDA